MSSPKEIAEKIIKGKEYITSIDTEPRILARAYLELEKEITKLKKSREWLRTAVEFYGNWVNSPDGIIHRSDCETIFVHEPLQKDKNGIIVAGKKAREAIKADDEIVKEV